MRNQVENSQQSPYGEQQNMTVIKDSYLYSRCWDIKEKCAVVAEDHNQYQELNTGCGKLQSSGFTYLPCTSETSRQDLFDASNQQLLDDNDWTWCFGAPYEATPAVFDIDELEKFENQDQHASCMGVQPPRAKRPSYCRQASKEIHLANTKDRMEGTGQWLFETSGFRDWHEKEISSCLWLYGSTGAGKSVLASAAVNYLNAHKRHGDMVAFLFCDWRFTDSHIVWSVLREMLRQLIMSTEHGNSSDHLLKLLSDLNSCANQLSTWDVEYLYSEIQHSLKAHETLFLVLDGLDGAARVHSENHPLIYKLLDLASACNNSHRVKVLVSSRPNCLEPLKAYGSPHVDLDNNPFVQEDLNNYIRKCLPQLAPSSSRRRDTAIELASRAGGIFLWARIGVSEIYSGFGSTEHLNSILDSLIPSAINSIYERMLNRVLQAERSLGELMLKWAAFAVRPLYLKEMQFILELDTEVSESDVLRMSGGLLLTNSEDGTIRFLHPTVREYLSVLYKNRASGTPWSNDPNEMITYTCLKALSGVNLLRSLGYSIMVQKRQSSDTEPSAILAYALQHWLFHYKLGEMHSRILPGLLYDSLRIAFKEEAARLHKESNVAGQSKDLAMREKSLALSGIAFSLRNAPANVALMAAAQFDFKRLAQLVLQMGADTNTFRGDYKHTPLHLAASFGHKNVVQLLLQYGADPNTASADGNTAFHFAVATGNVDIFRLLLEHGNGHIIKSEQGCAHGPSHGNGIKFLALRNLVLEASISEACPECGGMRTQYTISCENRDTIPSKIQVVGGKISRVESGIPLTQASGCCDAHVNYSALPHNSLATDRVIFRWLPGEKMHIALCIAAKRGMHNVRSLLLAVGNDKRLVDRITSITHLVSQMILSE